MRKLELVQPCELTPAHGEATDDPTVHRCRDCGQRVHELSEMRAREAMAFLEAVHSPFDDYDAAMPDAEGGELVFERARTILRPGSASHPRLRFGPPRRTG